MKLCSSTSGIVFAVIVCCLAVTPAFSQAVDQTSAAADSSQLTEILVTAQRRSERAQDVPISVTSVDSVALQEAGVTNMKDLPTVVSGLTFSGQGAWSQPSIRGVNTEITVAGGENPIAVYLDGIYQPSQNGILFDLPDIDHVEVSKGPQGTLFGRNATGGAIQVSTKDPTFIESGNFTATYGHYAGSGADASNMGSFSAFFAGPIIADTLAGSISAYYSKTEGYLRNIAEDGRSFGDILSRNVRGKLLFKPMDGLTILLTEYYSTRNDFNTEGAVALNGVSSVSQYPGSITPTQPWSVGFDAPTPLYRAYTNGGSLRVDLDLPLGTLTSLTGYTHLYSSADVDVDTGTSAACLAAFACIAYHVEMPDDMVSQEFDFASHRLFDRLNFVSGAFAYYDRSDLLQDANFGAFLNNTEAKTHAYAVFTEADLDVTSRLVAIAGVRYSREFKTGYEADQFCCFAEEPSYASRTYNSTIPRGSLRFKVDPDSNVYFTYSQGFKSGVMPGNALVHVEPTNPEHLRSYELGFKTAKPFYSLDIAGFYYNYSELQVSVFDGLTSISSNAATAKLAGIDMDAAAKISRSFDMHLTATYEPMAEYSSYPNATIFGFPLTAFGLTTYTPVNIDGGRINRTPKFTGSLTANYTYDIPSGAIRTSATLYHSSPFDWNYDGRVQTTQYTTIGADVNYKPSGANWSVSLYGKNLSDAKYINSATLSGTADLVMYAPPRLIGARVSYDF